MAAVAAPPMTTRLHQPAARADARSRRPKGTGPDHGPWHRGRHRRARPHIAGQSRARSEAAAVGVRPGCHLLTHDRAPSHPPGLGARCVGHVDRQSAERSPPALGGQHNSSLVPSASPSGVCSSSDVRPDGPVRPSGWSGVRRQLARQDCATSAARPRPVLLSAAVQRQRGTQHPLLVGRVAQKPRSQPSPWPGARILDRSVVVDRRSAEGSPPTLGRQQDFSLVRAPSPSGVRSARDVRPDDRISRTDACRRPAFFLWSMVSNEQLVIEYYTR